MECCIVRHHLLCDADPGAVVLGLQPRPVLHQAAQPARAHAQAVREPAALLAELRNKYFPSAYIFSGTDPGSALQAHAAWVGLQLARGALQPERVEAGAERAAVALLQRARRVGEGGQAVQTLQDAATRPYSFSLQTFQSPKGGIPDKPIADQTSP